MKRSRMLFVSPMPCKSRILVSLRVFMTECHCSIFNFQLSKYLLGCTRWCTRRDDNYKTLLFPFLGSISDTLSSLDRGLLSRTVAVKALVNEDTLLRTRCYRHKCFPVFPRSQHLLSTPTLCLGHKKCFWLVQKHFVSATNVSQFAQPISQVCSTTTATPRIFYPRNSRLSRSTRYTNGSKIVLKVNQYVMVAFNGSTNN